MVSSLFVLFLKFSHAAFPQGCVADNLGQVCQELQNIGTADVLVFATGEKMLGCHLRTKNMKDDNYDYILYQNYLFMGLLTKRFIKRSEFSHYLRNPEKILEIKNLTLEEKTIVNVYINLKANYSIQDLPTQNRPNLENEFKGVKNTLSAFLKSRPKFLHTNEWITKVEFGGEDKVRHDCEPNVNAWANLSKNTVGFRGNMSKFPQAARLQSMGHELAHHLEPCDIDTTVTFSEFIECIKNDVGKFSFTGGCDNHTKEAFCDNVGNYLIAQKYKNKLQYKTFPQPPPVGTIYIPPGYEIIIRKLDSYCFDKKPEGPTHPSPKRRLLDIFLRNPTIAKALGCPTDKPYCDIEKGLITPVANKTIQAPAPAKK